ncbi:helix-turn-helix transcriptional regulator [Enterococcus sp. AZ103]|uniref:helix-turn-helix transcriptional regulator n=1 Tax=Enterococcus sp. AZ103 TaxID=2774628 RepID=UPI003F25516E
MLGNILKMRRNELQLTQQQVADYLFVSRQTVSSWETENSFPDVPTLIKISDYYQMSLDALMKGDEKYMKKLKQDVTLFNLVQQGVFISIISFTVIIGSIAGFINVIRQTEIFEAIILVIPLQLAQLIFLFWITIYYKEDFYQPVSKIKLLISQRMIQGIIFLSFLVVFTLLVIYFLAAFGIIKI